MVTIIAGSRGLGYEEVQAAMLQCPWTPTTVISGGARGVDQAGETWAFYHRLPIRIFPADWEQYGGRAGYIRNKKMAEAAEALVAVWDGESKGTSHMIAIARRKGLKVYVHLVEKTAPSSDKTPPKPVPQTPKSHPE